MKYDVASPQWFAALHGILAQLVATEFQRSPGFRISVCEVFFNVPPGLGGGAGELAWSCVSDGPNVEFEMRERDDVESKARSDFSLVVESIRIDATDDPAKAAELGALVAAAYRSGKFVQERSGDSGLGLSLHNLLARLTA